MAAISSWLEDEKPSKVAFGTSLLRREIFPSHVPHTRFGNELNPITGAPNLGPGCYDNEEASNFLHILKNQPTSSKGYSLGARTAPRFRKDYTFLTPAPTHYQTKETEAREFDTAYKPFSCAEDRFPVRKADIEEVLPGPGTYEHGSAQSRKVQWHQSFGSMPINLPSVQQHSTIDKNTEKLISTKDEKKYQRRLAYLKLYYP